MYYMFYGAYKFNNDLSSWDVSSVASMYGMFYYASSFGMKLCNWSLLNPSVNVDYMFGDSNCSIERCFKCPTGSPTANPIGSKTAKPTDDPTGSPSAAPSTTVIEPECDDNDVNTWKYKGETVTCKDLRGMDELTQAGICKKKNGAKKYCFSTCNLCPE